MPSWIAETESKERFQDGSDIKVLGVTPAPSVSHVYLRAELATDGGDAKVMVHGAWDSENLASTAWLWS